MANEHILLIHTDRSVLQALSERVLKDGYIVRTASSTADAAALLSHRTVDVIVCENTALQRGGGDFLEWVQDRLPSAVVVVLSSWADFEMAIEGLERALNVRQKLDKRSLFAEIEEPAAEESPETIADFESLERKYPGITRLKTDANGFLILGD